MTQSLGTVTRNKLHAETFTIEAQGVEIADYVSS